MASIVLTAPAALSDEQAAYTAYLESAAWQQKREEAFAAYGRTCNLCEAPDNLHVHHLTYERLFNEDIADLQVLCRTCHVTTHQLITARRERLYGTRSTYYAMDYAATMCLGEDWDTTYDHGSVLAWWQEIVGRREQHRDDRRQQVRRAQEWNKEKKERARLRAIEVEERRAAKRLAAAGG